MDNQFNPNNKIIQLLGSAKNSMETAPNNEVM